MAGTATIRQSISITDLGSVPTLAETFTIASVGEQIYQVADLAASTAYDAVSLGQVDATAVQGVAIRLISGGTTKATGLSIDTESATWVTSHAVLLQGEMMWWRPGATTFIWSVKNLNTSACSYEYLIWGS